MFLKARLHRRFLSRNSLQFLSRWSCNFKIARVNQLRFQCDFSAIYRRGLRCNSRNTVILSSSFTFERAHAFVYEIDVYGQIALKSRWNRSWLQLQRDKNCIELYEKKIALCKRAFNQLQRANVLSIFDFFNLGCGGNSLFFFMSFGKYTPARCNESRRETPCSQAVPMKNPMNTSE